MIIRFKSNKYILLFSFLLIFSNRINGQNLILNGSFETIDSTINYTTFFEVAYPWLGQSADLYSTKKSADYLPEFPYFCKPVNGNNICGFLLYHNKDREIIVGGLAKPLLANHRYKLSFYYIPQQKGYKKNFTIDYCFAEKMNSSGNAPYSVNKTLTCFNFIPEWTRKWHFFETIITPTGNENYIIIWHLNNDINLKGSFYYYFDDFKLYDLDSNLITINDDSIPNIKTEVKKFILNEKLIFKVNEYILNENAADTLTAILLCNNNFNNCEIFISGYTDNSGSKKNNMELSEKRAKAVYEFMIKNGVNSQNISYQGLGEANPLTDNNTPVGRYQNRRVEIILNCND